MESVFRYYNSKEGDDKWNEYQDLRSLMEKGIKRKHIEKYYINSMVYIVTRENWLGTIYDNLTNEEEKENYKFKNITKKRELQNNYVEYEFENLKKQGKSDEITILMPEFWKKETKIFDHLDQILGSDRVMSSLGWDNLDLGISQKSKKTYYNRCKESHKELKNYVIVPINKIDELKLELVVKKEAELWLDKAEFYLTVLYKF